MSRKIVAIGGGENGRTKADGTSYPYETAEMDKEIIRLTGKKYPNFLMIAHSQQPSGEERYYKTMVNIYGKMYGCSCKNLLSKDLENTPYVADLINWADIIYEGGGDTQSMIELWKSTGFDKVLHQAWIKGKVLCGISAGAMCWFNAGVSDSLKIQLNDDSAPFIKVDCLSFIPAFYTPHCDEEGRLRDVKKILKSENTAGISVSNCAAIEIVDDTYRIIISDASFHNIEPFALKTYWKNDTYIEENIEVTDRFKSINELLLIS